MSEELLQKESLAEVEADNAQWDALLATDEAQARLEKLADEALTPQPLPHLRAVIFLFNLDWGRVWPGFLILGGLAMLLRA